MTISPADAAQKFNDGWINAKPRAISNYVAVASTLASKAIAQKTKLLTNFAKSVNDGIWERNLAQYAGNDLMGNAYTEKLNAIDALTPSELLKVENSVALKQYFESKLPDVLALYKAANSTERTVPTGITDVALNMMLMGGIIHFERVLTLASTPAAIYTATAPFMGTHYGWPNKA